ncbi:MAG: hypothetical protein EPN82_00740 [Bacteroidetes bacterium]|nr:MAG: hypothetical protein EPN82_00740 [Bacteroidota bacterium]
MNMTFNDIVDTVDELPPEEQEVLADVINKRIIERKRNEIINDVIQGEKDYQEGIVRRGSVSDLMKDLTE